MALFYYRHTRLSGKTPLGERLQSPRKPQTTYGNPVIHGLLLHLSVWARFCNMIASEGNTLSLSFLLHHIIITTEVYILQNILLGIYIYNKATKSLRSVGCVAVGIPTPKTSSRPTLTRVLKNACWIVSSLDFLFFFVFVLFFSSFRVGYKRAVNKSPGRIYPNRNQVVKYSRRHNTKSSSMLLLSRPAVYRRWARLTSQNIVAMNVALLWPLNGRHWHTSRDG